MCYKVNNETYHFVCGEWKCTLNENWLKYENKEKRVMGNMLCGLQLRY